MATPSSRLDIFVVPDDPDRVVDTEAVDAMGQAEGWWLHTGRQGPHAGALVPGGFARRHLHADPVPALYANQQGGFSVRCPKCSNHLSREFGTAVEQWRAGATRRMACVHCDWQGQLESLAFAPDAAFARSALRLGDVATFDVGARALAQIAAVWGPVRWIGRRTW